MPRQTVADLVEERSHLRASLYESEEETRKLTKELASLKLEMAKLEASQGEAKGAARAWESAYSRLVRHYELVYGKPETVAAIAEEQRQLYERQTGRHRYD